MHTLVTQIDSLRHAQAHLRTLVFSLTPAVLTFRPTPHEWSVVENVGHLIDTEQLLRARMQLLCAADNPTIVPYDQDAAVVRNGYQHADVWALWRTLIAERQTTLTWLGTLRPHHLQRRGWHGDYGLWTVGFIVAYLAKHDYLHYAQISAVIRQYNGIR
jgi:uncharacterized damage-inducible protein DinB